MRQARPDDVFSFVTPPGIAQLWKEIEPHLGESRPFWTWLLQKWGALADEPR